MSAAHRVPVLGAARPAIEARYHDEGAAAPNGAANPYRSGSAAATWWQRGHDVAAARTHNEGAA